MRISDWSSDVCSSDLPGVDVVEGVEDGEGDALPSDRLHAMRQPARLVAARGLGQFDGEQPGSHLPARRYGVAPVVEDRPGAGLSDGRPAERRVGKEWISTDRSRW